jgi:hypothetical protein
LQVSFEEFCDAVQRREQREESARRAEERERMAAPLSKEQRAELLRQSVAAGQI